MYGPDFPEVTVLDWVHTGKTCRSPENRKVCGSCGWFVGRDASLAVVNHFSDRLAAAAVIAAAPRLTAQNIAFNEVARQAIMRDPNFFDGNYADHNVIPASGVGLARMVGHITYLSDISMGKNLVVTSPGKIERPTGSISLSSNICATKENNLVGILTLTPTF